MLPTETAMLETYGVGRASLREALRILEINGLIRMVPGPGGGPMVDEVSSASFARMSTLYLHVSGATMGELLEARLLIEPVAARMAAENFDEAAIVALRESVAGSDAHVDPATSYASATADFHDLVAHAGGNRVLGLMARSLKDIYTTRVREVCFSTSESASVADTHGAIADAIANRNPDLAEELMRQHVLAMNDRMWEDYPGLLDEVVDWSA
jgi:DNA-binding FadR family transcriptional regulator